MTWMTLGGAPFITVSGRGLSNGLASIPNDGADFGPDTGGTTTSGIQEALNAIGASGGVVWINRGGYSLLSSIYNTGSFQTVIFATGVTLNFSSGGTYVSGDSLNGITDILVGRQIISGVPTSINFHDCYWYGNGCQVNCSGLTTGNGETAIAIWAAGTNSSPPSTTSCYNIVVDGFTCSGWGGAATFIGADNTNVDQSTYGESSLLSRWAVRHCSFYAKSGISAGSGFIVQGSAIEGTVEDVSCDLSTTSGDISNCFVRARAGPTYSLVFRRCYFKSNGSSGQVLEWQSNAGGSTVQADTHEILAEDCTFWSGAASGSPFGGSGGGYIDDNNGSATAKGNVFNLEFRRCSFICMGIDFSTSSVSGFTTRFGYLRFIDCRVASSSTVSPLPGVPSFSGSLTGRGPPSATTSITVGGSPWTYTNSDGIREQVIVTNGGGITAMSLNGTSLGSLTGGVFWLYPGDTLSITYTSAPTLSKQPR